MRQKRRLPSLLLHCPGIPLNRLEYDAVLDKYAEWLVSKKKRRLESHRYPSRASETHCQREGRESRFQVFR